MERMDAQKLINAIDGAKRIAALLASGLNQIARDEISREDGCRATLVEWYNRARRDEGPNGKTAGHLRAVLTIVGKAYREPQPSYAEPIMEYCKVLRADLGVATTTADPPGATGEPADNGMVLSSTLPWPADIDSDRKRRDFLADHKQQIPNEKRGQRRYVDAAAFVRYFAARERAASEALDGQTPNDGLEAALVPRFLSGAKTTLKRTQAKKRPRQ
jgi:hypothetical protein